VKKPHIFVVGVLVLILIVSLLLGGCKQTETLKLKVITTNDASNMTINSARLNGNLDDLGTVSSVDVSFEWGQTSGGPYPNETTPQAMNTAGAFSFDLSSLAAGTTYYFRAKAVGDSTSYGDESSFCTLMLRVVTSISLIAQIVERVGGDLVDVGNIIPPAQCPGHFDVKPGDIQRLADADLFLLGGWQGEMFTQELIDSADNPDLTVISLDIPSNPQSNWMTPSVQQEATDKIAAALSQVDTKNSTAYQDSATEYKDIIEAKAADIEVRLVGEDLASINVICSGMQAAFLKWVGLNVVTFYGRPDSLTPQAVQELVDTGEAENVTLIIDNLQSGQDAGAGIAEELGCARIILSNFPGGFDDTETWEKAIDHNIDLILKVIAQ